jgi:hypothetical protein
VEGKCWDVKDVECVAEFGAKGNGGAAADLASGYANAALWRKEENAGSACACVGTGKSS